jgi:hypothetical protein
MQALAFIFPTAGLIACLCIALRPHMMQRHVERVRSAWKGALPIEKVGLVFMCIPMPGPFDEAIGLVFLGLGRVQRYVRSYRTKRYIAQQIAEDTCQKHGMFCCPACYDMATASVVRLP